MFPGTLRKESTHDSGLCRKGRDFVSELLMRRVQGCQRVARKPILLHLSLLLAIGLSLISWSCRLTLAGCPLCPTAPLPSSTRPWPLRSTPLPPQPLQVQSLLRLGIAIQEPHDIPAFAVDGSRTEDVGLAVFCVEHGVCSLRSVLVGGAV